MNKRGDGGLGSSSMMTSVNEDELQCRDYNACLEMLQKQKPMLMQVETLRQEAIKQLPDEQSQKMASEDGLQYSDIHKLELDFRNIHKIDNLWDFTALVKLYLNNNAIQRIEGLEYLTNLEWLDLSSNNIEKIEGLDNLHKLETLLLANNRISVLEHMDALDELKVFNISNNCIDQRDNVSYLRKFKKLFSLFVCGNPAFMVQDYKADIAGQFPDLMYLDYKLIGESTKSQGNANYQYSGEETSCEDLCDPKASEEATKQEEAELKLHKDAFVEFLNGSHLFNSMFEDDPEAEVLRSVPGAAPLLQTFKDKMSQLCTQLFETGLDQHKQRETEMNLFFSGQRQALRNEQEKISDILTKFEELHEEKIEDLKKLSDVEQLTDEIKNFNSEVIEFCKVLIGQEVELLNGLEEIMELFDTSISEMVDRFVLNVKETFSLCQDLENTFYKSMCENAQATLENVAADKLEVDISEEVKQLFTDRQKVMGILETSHNNHLRKIKDRETQLIDRLSTWKLDLLKEIKDKHIKQNRFRLSCISAYREDFLDRLEQLQ